MKTEFLHSAGGLRALLSLHGLEARGTPILRDMEAPFLFLRRGGRYLAGAALLSPAGLPLYLLPRGFRLAEHPLQRRRLRPFLAARAPALLLLPGDKALLVTRCDGNLAHLHTPDGEAALTIPALLRRLPPDFTALTLENCPPQPQDMVPLLCESVRTLAAYRRELLGALPLTVTRQEMQPLHPLFRPLMVDLPAIAHLYADPDVALALRELAHIYRHLFIIGEHTALLRERLPAGLITRTTLWLQELILDRLYDLGVPEELTAPLHAFLRT